MKEMHTLCNAGKVVQVSPRHASSGIASNLVMEILHT